MWIKAYNLTLTSPQIVQYQDIPYSTKLWWEKTLADLELQENWQRKFCQLITLTVVQYLNSQELTTFGR